MSFKRCFLIICGVCLVCSRAEALKFMSYEKYIESIKVAVDLYFANIDANKDDKISFEEFVEYHNNLYEVSFKAWDKNGDGLLDKKEYAYKNENGKLTKDELVDVMQNELVKMFDKSDLDKDGFITKPEYLKSISQSEAEYNAHINRASKEFWDAQKNRYLN